MRRDVLAEPEISGQCSDSPARTIARVTGVAYLGIIATGIFAEFVVRGSLVVDDEPVQTARNIATSPGLFKIGIGADLVMIALDVVVALGLLRLLLAFDRRLTVTSVALRLVQGIVLALNLFNLLAALRHARRSVSPEGAVLLEPARQALDAVERHAHGYDAGLIAFGLSCIVLGRVLLDSGLFSRKLAAGMGVTGVVYVVGSLTTLFAEDLSPFVEPMYVVPLIVETAFAIQLVAWRRRFDVAAQR